MFHLTCSFYYQTLLCTCKHLIMLFKWTNQSSSPSKSSQWILNCAPVTKKWQIFKCLIRLKIECLCFPVSDPSEGSCHKLYLVALALNLYLPVPALNCNKSQRWRILLLSLFLLSNSCVTVIVDRNGGKSNLSKKQINK